MVTLIPMLMLSMTASTDASTPVAPLIPQNQGIGSLSIAPTNFIPVGKAKPRRKPKGTTIYLVSQDEMADFVCKHPFWLNIDEVYKNVPDKKPSCS